MNAPQLVLSSASSFGHDVVDAFRGTAVTIIDIAFTISVIACVLVLAWVLRRRLLKPDDAIRIAIRDLTADVPASEAAARALSEQLVVELRRANDGFRGAEDIDESEDLDGSPSMNLRALHGATELDAASMQDVSIQVGGVSTSFRSLLALWTQFAARPPAVSISGSFASTDPEAVLAIESARPRSAAARVEIRRRGDERRSDAIQDAASWILVQITPEIEGQTGSGDWRSLREYRSALACLEREATRPPNRGELLDQARLSLQASLAQDPGNLMARFYLGTVLRKLGENDAALGQFNQLQLDLQSSVARVSRFRRLHPTFLDVVGYNVAVVLTKLGNLGSISTAIAVLDSLLARADPPFGPQRGPHDPPADLLDPRLAMLAASARASALAARLNVSESPRANPVRLAAYRNHLRSQIITSADQLDSLEPGALDAERRTAVYARAVTYTARARATTQAGEWRRVIEDLRRAVTLAPDLVEAYLQLGALYLGIANRAVDWVERCEAALTTALAISPSNRRAHNLLGRLYARDAVCRYDDAIAHLQASYSYRSSLTDHAQLLELRGDLPSAVALLRRAVARFPRPGYHHQRFIEAVERLGEQRGMSHDDIAAARLAARTLWESSDRPQDRQRLAKHLAELDRLGLIARARSVS